MRYVACPDNTAGASYKLSARFAEPVQSGCDEVMLVASSAQQSK